MSKNRKQTINTAVQASQNKESTQHHDNIISINEQKRANRISAYSAQIAKKAYKSNFAYTIITGLLFVITLVIFWFNNEAINAAKQSSNTAEQTLIEYKEEFRKEHQAFLAVVPHFDIDEFKKRRVVDTYDWNVVGSVPLRIDSFGIRPHYVWDSGHNSRYTSDSMNVEEEFNKYGFTIEKQTYYLTENHPQTGVGSNFRFTFPKDYFDEILRGKRAILLLGKIYYTNLVTDEHFVYKYLIKMETDLDRISHRFVFSKNDIKP